MSDLLGGRGGRPLRIMLVALLKRLPKLQTMAYQARRLADALNHQAFEAGEMHPRIGPGSYTRAAQEMTEDADDLDRVVAFLGGVMEAEPPADPRIGFEEGGLSFAYDRGPRTVRLSPAAAVETFMPQGAFLAHPVRQKAMSEWFRRRLSRLPPSLRRAYQEAASRSGPDRDALDVALEWEEQKRQQAEDDRHDARFWLVTRADLRETRHGKSVGLIGPAFDFEEE